MLFLFKRRNIITAGNLAFPYPQSAVSIYDPSYGITRTGNSISAWADRRGANNLLAFGSNPTFVPNVAAANNMPGIQFTLAQSLAKVNPYGFGGSKSVFLWCVFISTSTSTSYSFFGQYGYLNGAMQLWFYTNPNLDAVSVYAEAGSVVKSDGTYSLNAIHSAYAYVNPSGSEGVALDNGTPTTAIFTPTASLPTNSTLSFGGIPGYGFSYTNGTLMWGCACNGIPTSNELSNMETWKTATFL
jgi:hypothetical protein